MRLHEFSAKNVFGYLNFDISFADSPIILIGPNGSGKTTALRLICALLAPSIVDLLAIDFLTASVVVEDQAGKRVVVAARRDKNELNLSISGVSGELRIATPPNSGNEFLAGGLQYSLEATRSFYLKYSGEKIFRAISEISSPVFLGLDRRGEVSGDDIVSDENGIVSYFSERSHSSRSKSTMRRSVLGSELVDVQVLIQKAYGRIRRIKDEQAQRLRKKLLLTGFEYADVSMSAFRIMPSDYDYSKTELYRKRDELVKALISIGIDAVDARKELDPFFDKVIDLGKRLNKLSESNERLNDGDTVFELMLNRANVTRLESLVKAVRDYNQRGASLSHRFDAFVSCVNEFFVDSRKEIEIDPVGILRIKRPDRVEIPIEALSSGERQLLIMLGHLYFNSFGDKSNVFIIDEPELSLHLRWQEMLLHKMLESNPRAQVVVATHSPEVVGEFSNHCVGI